MKKKLRKELNKLLPDNWEVGKYTLSEGDEFGDNIFNLKIYGEKHPTKDELLEKAKRDYPEGTVYDYTYNKIKTRCTVAGNGYSQNKYGIFANKSTGWLLYDGKWSEIIKKPILKLNNKFMYKGDEFAFIDKNDNWKLHDLKVYGQIYREYNPKAYFLTKQDALNYVLAEAKERFKNVSKIKFTVGDKRLQNISNDGKFYVWESFQNGFYINIDNTSLWSESGGWVAEPVKEPKLMLGNQEVEITQSCDSDGVPCDETLIKCNGGQVTKQQWLEWFYLFMSTRNVFAYSRCYLSNYMVKYKKKPFELKIGCIENVTMEQIQAITDRLNEV